MRVAACILIFALLIVSVNSFFAHPAKRNMVVKSKQTEEHVPSYLNNWTVKLTRCNK